MKINLDRIEVTQIDVELPEICPNCKADLTEPNAMRENQFTATQQDCNILTDRGEDSAYMDEYGETEVIYEMQYVTGYTCKNCECDIVTTEIKPAAEEAASVSKAEG